MLLISNVWFPIAIVHDRQQEYYVVIDAFNDAGESAVFIEFLLSTIKASLIEAINTSIEMSVEKVDITTLRWNRIHGYLKTYSYT